MLFEIGLTGVGITGLGSGPGPGWGLGFGVGKISLHFLKNSSISKSA